MLDHIRHFIKLFDKFEPLNKSANEKTEKYKQKKKDYDDGKSDEKLNQIERDYLEAVDQFVYDSPEM